MSEKQNSKEELDVPHSQMLFGEINDKKAAQICGWILGANLCKNKHALLNLTINSHGGDLHSAFAIIDVMASSHIPIRTIGLGHIQSAGLMIFMAGTKCERCLTPNVSIMSHQYSSGSEGKHGELFAVIKEFKMTSKRMLNHYKKHTSLSKKDIMKHLLAPTDSYLSIKDALKLGICDIIAA